MSDEPLSEREQEIYKQYQEKWFKVFTDTSWCDRKKAEHWALEWYKVVDFGKPKMFFWAYDPTESGLQMTALKQLQDYRGEFKGRSLPKGLLERLHSAYIDVLSSGSPVAMEILRVFVGEFVRLSYKRIKRPNGDQPIVYASIQANYPIEPIETPRLADLAGEGIDDVIAYIKSMAKWVIDDMPKGKVAEGVVLHVSTMMSGMQDARWMGHYEFFWKERNHEDIAKIHPLMEHSKECGWWAAYEHFCFLQEKPAAIRLIDSESGEVPHCETGPAIQYKGTFHSDGYYLNNVRVPSYVVTTPAEELDSRLILVDHFEGFVNTDEIRSEIMKKIGPKKIIKDLDFSLIEKKTGEELWRENPIGEYYQQGDILMFPLDSKGKEVIIQAGRSFEQLPPDMIIRLRNKVFYELYSGIVNGATIKALRMGNPSLDGEEHIEYVHHECTNIFDAYVYRNFRSYGDGDWQKLLINKKACLPKQLS